MIDTPQVAEHEAAVLACCFVDDEARSFVLENVEDVDLLDANGRKVLKAIRQLDTRGERPSFNTIRLEIEAVGATVDLGYLGNLEVDLPDIYRVEQYVQTLKRARIRRELLDGAREVALRCKSADDSAIAAAREMLRRAEKVEKDPGALTFRGHLDAALTDLRERRVGGICGAPTGIARLDKMTLGLQPGQLILIAGRPGVGKSVLGLHIARECAFRNKLSVAVASLEMSPREVVNRVLAAETGIEHERIRGNYLNQAEREVIEHCAGKIAGWDFHLEDAIGWKTTDLERRVRAIGTRYGVDLVIVDYLGLVGTESRHPNDNSRIAEISLSLKQLARSLNIPVVALAQLSRSCEQRPNKRPILSDLRDSGSLEQDADVVIFLYRDSYYEAPAQGKENAMELIIAKQRAGATGTVDCRWYPKQMRFEDAP